MEQYRVKFVSSVEKVFPAKEPAGAGCMIAGEEKKLVLSALKGETISFQIAYCWNGNGRRFGHICAKAPEDLNVRTRIVKLVPCAYPCHTERDEQYVYTEPGLYPDLLSEIPGHGFPMICGQWRSLWVDVEVSEEAMAGAHEIEIDLGCRDCREFTEELKVSVDVIDTELPLNPILHTEWFHSDGLAQYYQVDVFSEEYWRIVENFVFTASRRGCNMLLTPVFTPPLDTAVDGERLTVQLVDVYRNNGEYSFGFEKFERWIHMCNRCQIRYFEISHLFSQWGAKYAPKVIGIVDGEKKQIFGWDTDGTGAEYAAFLQVFLDALLCEIEKLRIEKRCYFHISDEPDRDQLESYRAARSIVEEKLKDYPIIDAMSDITFYKQGIVQEPICATDHIEPFLQDRPKRLWAYYCTGQWKDVSNRFIVMQGSRTRILGLQLYKYEIDGFLHWGYNFYNSQYSLYPIDPYQCTDADGAFPSGDPFLVYPGEGGTPEESIRLMLMSEVMNDLGAMKLLEALAGRSAVMKCFEEEKYGAVTFSKYPTDLSYVTEVRMRVNQAIQEIINSEL